MVPGACGSGAWDVTSRGSPGYNHLQQQVLTQGAAVDARGRDLPGHGTTRHQLQWHLSFTEPEAGQSVAKGQERRDKSTSVAARITFASDIKHTFTKQRRSVHASCGIPEICSCRTVRILNAWSCLLLVSAARRYASSAYSINTPETIHHEQYRAQFRFGVSSAAFSRLRLPFDFSLITYESRKRSRLEVHRSAVDVTQLSSGERTKHSTATRIHA